MTIETEVAALTTATTTLLSAVNVAKSTLDASTAAASASAGTAATHAGTATTQAGTATTQAGIATTKAGEASTHASTATTQAGIATTKAGEANASAIAAAASAAATASAIVTERTATATLTNKTLTSPDINGGTVDGAVIGGAVPAAGSFTTLSAAGSATVGNGSGNNAVLVNSTTSGTGGGGAAIVQNGGTSIIAIGNKSALLGGAYNATPMLYGSGATIEVNTGISVTGRIIATGALTTAGLKEDASGNLGLGVTPSAWGSTWKSMQIGIVGAIAAQTNTTAIHVSSNEYINSGGTSTYIASDFASKYRQISGIHSWYTAPSGTAGDPISFTQAMTLDASGNLLVGKATNDFSVAGVKIEPLGTILITRDSYNCLDLNRKSDGSIVGFYQTGASVGSINITSTTTAYNTSSDARLKTNIADSADAASLIDALQVRQFDWKSDGSHQRYGFVAQELYEVAPEAVSKPQDPEEMMAVDYSKLVPMLVKEIQALRVRVAALEPKLNGTWPEHFSTY